MIVLMRIIVLLPSAILTAFAVEHDAPTLYGGAVFTFGCYLGLLLDTMKGQ